MEIAEETLKELPDECWAMIFNHLTDESDQESITLVCRRFLTITNVLRVSLNVSSSSITVLRKLLRRFCNLKKIQLESFRGDLSNAALTIAQSGLDLEELNMSFNGNLERVCFEGLGSTMKNLKVLNCSNCLSDADLVRIANSIPQLEELQIGQSFYDTVKKTDIAVTDEGIDYLSMKLKRLRKIDLSHNLYISDKSLVSLSSNCAFLEHVTISYCPRGVTENGIAFLIQNSNRLRFLHLCAHFKIESINMKSSTNFLTNLQSLRFINLGISDEFLYSVADAQLPLTELYLSFCQGFTFNGIEKILQLYHQSLISLVLRGAKFLTNKHIEYLYPFLYNLTSIKLYNCPELSDSAFAMFMQGCPLLCRIQMSQTNVGRIEYKYDGLLNCIEDIDIIKNFSIKYLNLSSNSMLSNSGLKRILNMCPKVEKLKLYTSFQRKEELDVIDVLGCSRELVNLVLQGCHSLKTSKRAAEFSKLQLLFAESSGINDEMLAILGRSCPRLVHLSLKRCDNVSEEGIKEVVKSCKRLRYLSLSSCTKMHIDIVAWIVTNCPSLRKLISPSHKYPDEESQNRFLQQGCLVKKGEFYVPEEPYY